MNPSRRDFLRTGCAFAIGQRLARDPTLGLIVPAIEAVPAEALALYPAGIRFVTESLSKPGDARLVGTLATYERLQKRIVPAAQALVEKGADAIVLLGTSVTFYKGAVHNQSLIDSIQRATKRPATTMSSAIVDALRAAGGKRLAVASGYTQEVNAQFGVFLRESGFDIDALRGLGLLTPPDNLNRTQLEAFVVDVFQTAPSADAVVVAFASTRTLERLSRWRRAATFPWCLHGLMPSGPASATGEPSGWHLQQESDSHSHREAVARPRDTPMLG